MRTWTDITHYMGFDEYEHDAFMRIIEQLTPETVRDTLCLDRECQTLIIKIREDMAVFDESEESGDEVDE